MKLASVLILTLFGLGCGGYGSNYKSQTGGTGTTAAAASVSALVPTSATAGGPGFTLTVNGTAFSSNSIVYFGGAARATTFVTSSQLMATIPASAIATAGSMPVYVNSPGSTYTVASNSNMVNFTVN